MNNLYCKDENVLRACLKRAWHPILIDIFVWLTEKYGEGVLVTEGWREAKSPSDVHATDPIRAFDIRSRNFTSPEIVAENINKNWTYDPGRPEMKVALLHDAGSGMHFHIQVHQNTKRREI